MSADLTKSPDYETLVASLLEKTLAGKIRWEETAVENSFLAAVKGRQTFQISGNENGADTELQVRDQDGKVRVKLTRTNQQMMDLYSAARRIALGVDEVIDESLELLNSL